MSSFNKTFLTFFIFPGQCEYFTCITQSHSKRGSNGSQLSVILEEIFLQFGKDMLPVGVLTQGRDMGSKQLNQSIKKGKIITYFHLNKFPSNFF